MGQLEVVGLASAAIGIFTSVECEFLQVGTAASIKLGFATDFYVYDDLVVQSNAYVNTGVVTTIEGSDLTYDEITGTTVQAVGLRATNFATPNAKINVGIITTLIVPPYNVNTGDSWAGISTAYIGAGIVTTLIVPAGGWIGAPQAYINSGIVTTISGTDATYTNVNANNVYSPYIAGQTGGNPAGAGVLYVQNAQVGSKLWLSGTAAGEGLRANVGIITYFGHNAKSLLGNLDSSGNNMHINAGSDGIIQASQLRSTIAQGAAPFTVVSTTKVTNLNVDLLDGKSATSSATANTIMSRNGSANSALNKLTSTTIDNSGNIDTNTLDASTADITTLNVTGSINGNSNYPLIDQFRMGKYLETFNDLGNKSGTVNLDTSTGNNFRIRITGNTSINFTNIPVDSNNSSADIYSTQIIVKNGTGGASLTWNGNIKWPGGSTPSRTTNNGAEDIWVFISYDSGSTWYGNLALPDMK
tara:strand:- start:853 stop:2268 length:1416 start_codon:yes stop_codon:yes gene_type:complete